ncbi:MAG: recombination mediator RecR [Firmicutes bacterium]|nr:recombination mediator RecR [Bacillota bacterium]
MSVYIEPLARAVNALSKLPGVGGKSALRLAYHIIDMEDSQVRELCDALLAAKEEIHYCSVCGNFCQGEKCGVCSDPQRDKGVICVVKDPRDVMSMERMRDYEGTYHVLHGTISPMNGVGPDDIRIKELLARLDGVREVIIATNPDVEGDATAMYLSRLIKPLGIKVTRIAHGIPIGGDLEYIDEVTLSRAMAGRREM